MAAGHPVSLKFSCVINWIQLNLHGIHTLKQNHIVNNHHNRYLDLPKGAEWMIRGAYTIYTPSFRIKQHPLEDAGKYMVYLREWNGMEWNGMDRYIDSCSQSCHTLVVLHVSSLKWWNFRDRSS